MVLLVDTYLIETVYFLDVTTAPSLPLDEDLPYEHKVDGTLL